MPSINVFFKALIIALFSSVPAQAFFNIQTTTAVGIYRDYQKNEHTPLYHSWSIKGMFSNGFETSLEFYANNDFSVNEWHVQPTQALISFPIYSVYENRQNILSEVKLGRMLFTEGFSLGLFDGGEVIWRWSRDGGAMPFAGYLRPSDFSDKEISNAPVGGLVLWESLAEFNFRLGAIAKDKDFADRVIFLGLQKQFVDLPLQPSLLLKNEWLADTMGFNQASYDLQLQLSEKVDFTLGYANLEPRPINALDNASFVYKLFSVSPTETARAGLGWAKSQNLVFSLSAEGASYNSGTQTESSVKSEIAFDWQWAPGDWLSPSLTYLKSYGGEVEDAGIRYVSQMSALSKWTFEYNAAYMKKINQISGWAQNLRGSIETHFWDRAKIGFAVEVERNQYYIFDTRAQVYVTNYL